MPSELGAWLRQQREDRGWTRSELARQLIKAARAKGDTSVPGADNIGHNIYRWERGTVAPAERYRLYYCGVFGIPFSQFGTSPPPGMVDAGPGTPAAAAYRGLPSPDPAPAGPGASAIRREVLMAAHEGSDHAERIEQRGIGEATLEQFRADVVSLSVQYMTGEPAGLFMEMRRVRNRILEALDRRQWPHDAAELYLLAGCLNALMAAAATNLGYPEAAEELTRAGWAYATIIKHRPLMARLRLCAAYAAYWNGHPGQSANLARSGPASSRAQSGGTRPGRAPASTTAASARCSRTPIWPSRGSARARWTPRSPPWIPSWPCRRASAPRSRASACPWSAPSWPAPPTSARPWRAASTSK